MGLLEGRSAIVTGASSGIGRAIALRFAAEGARLALADLREQPIEGGEPTLELIRKAGGEAFYLTADVSRWADVDRLVSESARPLRPPRRHGQQCRHLYRHQPGGDQRGAVEQGDGVNVNGHLLRLQARRARDADSGAGRRGARPDRQHLLPAWHGGLAGRRALWGEQIQRRLYDAADRGRTMPGSDRLQCGGAGQDRHRQGPGSTTIRRGSTMRAGRTPWPRLGRPEDVASAALFLASDMASFVTGVI